MPGKIGEWTIVSPVNKSGIGLVGSTASSAAPSRAERRHRAKLDVLRAMRSWPVVILIGSSDVSARYRRSTLGQLWITLSHAVTVLSIGIVWAYIWNQPTHEFLPYFAVGQVIWLYMTGVLADSTTTYADHTAYLRELNLPRSTYLLSNMVKHLIFLGHNALILPLIFLVFGFHFSIQTLLFFPAFLLMTVFLFACTTVLGIAGLRFRDISSIVGTVISITYFLTPVIWRLDALPPSFTTYMLFNPFAVFLELLRAPILGQTASAIHWLIAFGLTIAALLLAARVFISFRGRITYWL